MIENDTCSINRSSMFGLFPKLIEEDKNRSKCLCSRSYVEQK